MHLITTLGISFPLLFSVTSSAVHDVKALDRLPEEKAYLHNNEIFGYRGYILDALQLRPFEQKGIKFITQIRTKIKTTLHWKSRLGAETGRLETVFSLVQNQFRPDQNFAKTFNEIFIRITHKLAVLLHCKLSNLQNGRFSNLVKCPLFCSPNNEYE